MSSSNRPYLEVDEELRQAYPDLFDALFTNLPSATSTAATTSEIVNTQQTSETKDEKLIEEEIYSSLFPNSKLLSDIAPSEPTANPNEDVTVVTEEVTVATGEVIYNSKTETSTLETTPAINAESLTPEQESEILTAAEKSLPSKTKGFFNYSVNPNKSDEDYTPIQIIENDSPKIYLIPNHIKISTIIFSLIEPHKYVSQPQSNIVNAKRDVTQKIIPYHNLVTMAADLSTKQWHLEIDVIDYLTLMDRCPLSIRRVPKQDLPLHPKFSPSNIPSFGSSTLSFHASNEALTKKRPLSVSSEEVKAVSSEEVKATDTGIPEQLKQYLPKEIQEKFGSTRRFTVVTDSNKKSRI